MQYSNMIPLVRAGATTTARLFFGSSSGSAAAFGSTTTSCSTAAKGLCAMAQPLTVRSKYQSVLGQRARTPATHLNARPFKSSAVRNLSVDGGGDPHAVGEEVVGLADGGRLGSKAEPRKYRTVVPAAERLVVIGDVHGDIAALRSCLRMAGLVDGNDHWSGGETVVVQVGDIFDRGDDDLRIEEWIHLLARDAEEANGAIYSVLGNHEVLNAAGDHSMATRKAFIPFDDLMAELDELVEGDWSDLEGFPPWARCRVLAMRPCGPVAQLMAAHAVCMKVGDNLFVHAGLRPRHFRGAENAAQAETKMEQMNGMVAEWMLTGETIPHILFGEESPVWTRLYSNPDSRDIEDAARAELEEVLRLTGTKRMLVGHTPQRLGINSAADGQIWRVDTGMTAMIGGRPEVLEIKGDEITILTEHRALPASKRASQPLPPAEEDTELRQQ